MKAQRETKSLSWPAGWLAVDSLDLLERISFQLSTRTYVRTHTSLRLVVLELF